MEFGYAAALALIMTALLLLVIYAYVRRAARDL
jgi:multiple sugar transport system permease protein